MAFDSERVRFFLKAALLTPLSNLFVYRRMWPYSMFPSASDRLVDTRLQVYGIYRGPVRRHLLTHLHRDL
jgi:hypothetical protein